MNLVAKIIYRKMWKTAYLADDILASQEEICFTLVGQSLGLLVSQSYSQLIHENSGRYNSWSQWRTQEFCLGGGVQQIQLRTEDRENGDLRAVAP